MTTFEQQFHTDEEYELFVRAWMAYHKAADEIDGHLPYGTTEAAMAGQYARENVLISERYIMVSPSRIIEDPVRKEKWQAAKLEALRRLGK